MPTAKYLNKPTQEEKILDLLRQRGDAGVFVWELMTPINRGGLGIAQYNARIKGLRDKGFTIDNVKPGHFVLVEKPPYKEIKLEDTNFAQLAFV